MVKLAEKERDNLEVLLDHYKISSFLEIPEINMCCHDFIYQGVKNEAEAYMLKELSLLKWHEKATKLAFEDNSARIMEMQDNIYAQEENLKTERWLF